jgi:hypothetical protein
VCRRSTGATAAWSRPTNYLRPVMPIRCRRPRATARRSRQTTRSNRKRPSLPSLARQVLKRLTTAGRLPATALQPRRVDRVRQPLSHRLKKHRTMLPVGRQTLAPSSSCPPTAVGAAAVSAADRRTEFIPFGCMRANGLAPASRKGQEMLPRSREDAKKKWNKVWLRTTRSLLILSRLRGFA